jgi:hypothetical protein
VISVAQFNDQFGFDVVDAGPLKAGGTTGCENPSVGPSKALLIAWTPCQLTESMARLFRPLSRNIAGPTAGATLRCVLEMT